MKTFFLKLSAGLKNLFLSNGRFKYWLLMIVLKPFFTYNIYPHTWWYNIDGGGTKVFRNPEYYHIENILTYKPITFIYTGVLVLLLYLFINSKKK
tara:strand:+ start:824 stop:1108 length:285 start_codon:yes stop_codon:yes gene_type:complete